MSGETLEEAARLVADSGYPRPRLTLTGGEPLLEPRLVAGAASALRRAARQGRTASLSLSTNGTALDPGTAHDLATVGAEVMVSLDGVLAAQSLRSGDVTPALERTLRRIAEAEPEWFARSVGVRITLHSGNVRFLGDSVLFLSALGFRRIEVSPLVTRDVGWDVRSGRELDRRLEGLATTALPAEPREGPPLFRPFAPPSRRTAGRGPMCGLGSPESLFLDVDGSVAPCGAMIPSLLDDPPPLVREAVDTLAGVQVPDPALRERMRARAARAVRLAFARDLEQKCSPRGPCASCEALPECFVCPASIAFAPEQDPNLVPTIQCDWNRLVAKHRRAFLARLASREADLQRAGSSSSAAETSAVTPARIDGA